VNVDEVGISEVAVSLRLLFVEFRGEHFPCLLLTIFLFCTVLHVHVDRKREVPTLALAKRLIWSPLLFG
jgi:hypothetical protein